MCVCVCGVCLCVCVDGGRRVALAFRACYFNPEYTEMQCNMDMRGGMSERGSEGGEMREGERIGGREDWRVGSCCSHFSRAS